MLILLVASIPVALPAVMSVTMAIGAYALSKQKAILSRLSAIEELAGVDVLCSDKTGTLTMNQLTVDAEIPFGSAKPDDVLTGAALATQISSEDADRSRGVARAQGQVRACRVQADRLRAVRSGQQAHGGNRHRCQGRDPTLCQGCAAGDRRAGQGR